MSVKVVYCLYCDGAHVSCFDSYDAAERYAIVHSSDNLKFLNFTRFRWDIEEDVYDGECSCGNKHIDKYLEDRYHEGSED